jgi:hypothetical protein
LSLRNPRLQTNKEEQEGQDLSLAVIATDLRKAFLYDLIHNVILLVACVAFIASLWNIVVDVKNLLIGLLVLSLSFGQLPFIIG